MKLSPLVPGPHCRLPHLPSLKWRMTTSSRSPTKLSHATQAVPSGAAAMEGQSSCRNWWPTAVALICAHNGAIETSRAAARNRGGIIGSLYSQWFRANTQLLRNGIFGDRYWLGGAAVRSMVSGAAHGAFIGRTPE